LFQLSCSDYKLQKFTLRDYQTSSYCYLQAEYTDDEVLSGFEVTDKNSDYCDYKAGDFILVEVEDQNDIVSLVLPDELEIDIYQYDDLYGENEYYEYFSYEIVAVPSSEEIPEDDKDFIYEGDYIDFYSGDQSLETFSLNVYIDGEYSYCSMTSVFNKEEDILEGLTFDDTKYNWDYCLILSKSYNFIEFNLDDDGEPISLEGPDG
jgi:hypothetical protein